MTFIHTHVCLCFDLNVGATKALIAGIRVGPKHNQGRIVRIFALPK